MDEDAVMVRDQDALQQILDAAEHDIELILPIGQREHAMTCCRCGDHVCLVARSERRGGGMTAVFPTRMLVACQPTPMMTVLVGYRPAAIIAIHTVDGPRGMTKPMDDGTDDRTNGGD